MANSNNQPDNRKSPSSRRVGRPKRGREAITPEQIEEIGRLWLQGVRLSEIALKFEVDRTTIRHYLDNHLRPAWQESVRADLAADLARVRLLESVAWSRFESSAPAETVEQIERGLVAGKGKLRIIKRALRSITKTGDAAWLDVIKWCLEYRMRVHGYAAPARHHVDLGGELRVAGMSPTQVDTAMLTRLHEQILERRRLHPGLGGDPN